MESKIKVLCLCSYPIEAAASRFRVYQYAKPLSEKGIEITIKPFLDSSKFADFYNSKNLLTKVLGLIKPLAARFSHSLSARKYDVVFVQREAMMFGPAFFEWLAVNTGNCPLILDLDDATYVQYISPTYGKLGSKLKFFGKTDSLIKSSHTVVCGNRYIADYVEKLGTKTVIVPTVADTDVYCPIEKNNEIPILGWIGTHSTFPLLESIFPVLRKLAEKHQFILQIVGAGRDDIKIDGVNVRNRNWKLENEVSDFQILDIGLYPIKISESAPEQWILGKSGFKAIQYLSCGVPFLMTPIGVCQEIGIPNETHFNALTDEDWYNSLDRLLSDSSLRKKMGIAGRQFALSNYTVNKQAAILDSLFRSI